MKPGGSGREKHTFVDRSKATEPAAGSIETGKNGRLRLIGCLATIFVSTSRRQACGTCGVKHEVVTLVGQRVFGITLSYEDLNDHDELRHDPVMAVLAGKLEARRDDCAPVAGKSTLNRLELSRLEATRYRKISHNPIAIKRLMVDLFLDAHKRAPMP